ncbi:MAG: acyl-CoA dehydrogenase family protein [Acetobacteraceae bacterium]
MSTHILAEIADLAPRIVSRMPEIEAARRVPPDLVETLRASGIFRMFVPRIHGGLELDLPTGLAAFAAMARVESSVGWIAMIGATPAIFAPLLPRRTYNRIYRDGPDVIFAATARPSGTAEAVSGGWRVTGRWPFMSGCQHADYIIGFCVMAEQGKPLPCPAGEAGPPRLGAFVLPARDWQIEDTWHVTGLKGTGSQDTVLRDVLVPEENFLDLATMMSCVPGPLYTGPLQTLPLVHGANSVGIAEGALDALVALAQSGRQQFHAATPLRDSGIFQYELGRVQADIRAARAMLETQAASHWRHAVAGTLNQEALQIEATQAATWLTAACVRATDACFALAGSSAVYDTSPLQQRLRDMRVAAQHASVQQRNYQAGGRLLLSAAA